MRLDTVKRLEQKAGIRTPKYFRLWDPSTPTGARRLLCFRDPGRNGYQERISEAEYLAACPDALPNVAVETMAGQL